MSTIELFGAPGSPFVKKIQAVLALKKLEYQLVEPRSPGDLKKWNPRTGKMPVLRIAGKSVYDSTFIAERLEADFPEPPLWSTDPAARAGQRLIEDWADESLYFYLMALRWCPKHEGATLTQITSGLPPLMRPIARPILRRSIGGSTRAQGLGRLPKDDLVREIGGRLDDLEALRGSRPYFYSDTPSLADLALTGQLEMGMSGPTPEVNELVGSRPELSAYLVRVIGATGA